MKKIITLVVALAAAAALSIGSATAGASTGCTVAGKSPVINGAGHLNTRFALNCTAGQSWVVFATVQAFANGSWTRAANTNEATVNGSGDSTVSAEVETGQWSCVSGRSYRSHVVLQNGNSDNSFSVELC